MKSFRTVKTSIILVSEDGRIGAYQSMEEVPERLRGRLSGTASGKVLIADRQGREQILRALLDQAREAAQGGRRGSFRSAAAAWLRTWGAILLAGAAGLAVWLLCTIR